jgi:hypothetical protein
MIVGTRPAERELMGKSTPAYSLIMSNLSP